MFMDSNSIPETIHWNRSTNINYKIKLPVVNGKTEALLNIDKEHYYVGGDVWICLWFREGKMGNQISLEYNRFSEEEIIKSNSNGNSIGKFFVESYVSIELISFLKKSLNIFQKIIGKRENERYTTKEEFDMMVMEEFKEDDGNKKITDF